MSLTIFTKSHILDVWLNSEQALKVQLQKNIVNRWSPPHIYLNRRFSNKCYPQDTKKNNQIP